jgi:hypothetical protein
MIPPEVGVTFPSCPILCRNGQLGGGGVISRVARFCAEMGNSVVVVV